MEQEGDAGSTTADPTFGAEVYAGNASGGTRTTANAFQYDTNGALNEAVTSVVVRSRVRSLNSNVATLNILRNSAP